tara:strand:+ start:2488 stop:3618 length:1131 start_codon:yes stop_codon:yes gene_type:complete
MRKLIIFVLAGVFLINLASAVNYDVAYIVTNEPESEFIDAMEDLELSYDIIHYQEINSLNFNFDNYKIILLNNDYFVNWNKIPINDKPALIASSYHLDKWGWAVRSTIIANTPFIHVNLNTEHEISGDLPLDFQVYESSWKEIYVLDKRDIYNGFEIVGKSVYDEDDVVVGAIREGTTLTKDGYSDTIVNANSVWFGITKSGYWGDESEQLFKNSLLWLYEEDTLDINLKEGHNLISIPLILSSNDINDILINNPEIISVKEYVGTITETSTIENNKGYFLESISDSTLTLEGRNPSSQQTVDLVEGMNLVGITSLDNISLTKLPSEVIEVARRNEDGSYDIATKYGIFWFNSFELEPGKGYWFKLNDDVIWSYNP